MRDTQDLSAAQQATHSKKRVSSSSLALRFYKKDGWTLECLEPYLIRGEFFDTERNMSDQKADAYFVLAAGSKLDVGPLYAQEVGEVERAFNDFPLESDLQFLHRLCWV